MPRLDGVQVDADEILARSMYGWSVEQCPDAPTRRRAAEWPALENPRDGYYFDYLKPAPPTCVIG
jgi:hypothetical protein